MATDQDLAKHYGHGSLEQALLAALAAAGKDPEKLTVSDLMGTDEFHVGGAQATSDLAAQLALTPAMHLLDLGSGIGGPARHLATTHGCRVTGIDLTSEYVSVATSLTRRMGLSALVDFREASATAPPFADSTFDGVTLIHVGMNIANKAAMCAQAYRVLRPGGFFAIYDVMRAGPGDLQFPLPWSSGPQTSFVEPLESYQSALTKAGFTIAATRNRAQFARDFFAALRARQAQSGPSPLGLQLLMGPTTPQKIGNLASLIDRGVLAPTEVIARR